MTIHFITTAPPPQPPSAPPPCIQTLLDMLEMYYWHTPSASSFGRTPPRHVITGDPIGARPDGGTDAGRAALRALRAKILDMVEMIAAASLTAADADAILGALSPPPPPPPPSPPSPPPPPPPPPPPLLVVVSPGALRCTRDAVVLTDILHRLLRWLTPLGDSPDNSPRNSPSADGTLPAVGAALIARLTPASSSALGDSNSRADIYDTLVVAVVVVMRCHGGHVTGSRDTTLMVTPLVTLHIVSRDRCPPPRGPCGVHGRDNPHGVRPWRVEVRLLTTWTHAVIEG